MARTFGKRSYSPENVSFSASGAQPSGLPWSVVQRSIPKNILLQASNNPSTLEELSIELGIALPYMEEEVGILHRATLLEKQGDKYVTNFFIQDRDCVTEVYHALRKHAKERSCLLSEAIEDSLDAIRALGIAGAHLDDNTLRWWLTPTLIDWLIEYAGGEQDDIYDPPVRANGESWGFVGYEAVELPEVTVMGHNGNGNGKNAFWTYKYGDYGMRDQCGGLQYEEIMLLCDCLRSNRSADSFTEIEARIWERICGRYAHLSEDRRIVPDILVVTAESLEQIHQLFRRHKNYGPLTQNVADAYEKVEAIFKKYSHRVLHDSIGYYIKMDLYAMRMMAIHDLVEDKILRLPEDPKKSSLGMNLFLQ